MILLDTDVLIDILRGHPTAKRWIENNADIDFAIHGVVAMEIVQGSRNKAELQHNRRLLKGFKIVWPDSAEFQLAFELLSQHNLAVGIGIPDCLIAATAISRSLILHSFNAKHYQALPNLQLQTPYQR